MTYPFARETTVEYVQELERLRLENEFLRQENETLRQEDEASRQFISGATQVLITNRGFSALYAAGSFIEAESSLKCFYEASAGLGDRGTSVTVDLRQAPPAAGISGCAVSDFVDAEIRTLGGHKLDGIVSRCDGANSESMQGEDPAYYEASFQFQAPDDDDETSATPIMSLWVRFGPIREEFQAEAGAMDPLELVHSERFTDEIIGGVTFDRIVFNDTRSGTMAATHA